MAKVPMGYIFEYLDFQSILSLRKTCHHFRNFIDNTKPASRLTEIQVTVNPESIYFITEPFYKNKHAHDVDYVKRGEGCFIHREKEGIVKRTILENEDFVTIFCKDFDIVLRHQKTVLEEFKIKLDLPNSTVKKRVLQSVNKSLKSMEHPLQVKSLCIGVSNHKELLTILPYIDPKPLKMIYIYDVLLRDNAVFNLDEIGQLEQWKQADELWIDGFQIPDASQNLKYFSKLIFRFREFPAKELVMLKEIFLSSSTLNTIEILYDRCCDTVITQRIVIKQTLIEAFGHLYIDIVEGAKWYFSIPNTNQFLEIKYYDLSIHFNLLNNFMYLKMM